MVRRAAERLAQRGLGVLDGALAIARQPVIDPGLGPGGGEPEGGGEGLLGPRRLTHREPRLAIGVVRLRQMGCGVAGVAGGAQCRPRVIGLRMGSVGGEER